VYEFNDLERPTRLTSTPRVAAEVLGTPLQTVYRLIGDGTLRSMPGPGRKRILTSSLEAIAGRRLTEADFIAAEERSRPKRDKALAYLARYRAERAFKAAKRASTGGTKKGTSDEKASVLRVHRE
jgi:excisionase family DNA binding protein